MRDANNCVVYWLFFCSNNLRGLEEMKRAMWTVDRSGGFEFSDKHAQCVGKLFDYDEKALASDLVESLDGRTLTVAEIEEYVLVNTPACKYRRALGNLERTGRLEVIDPPVPPENLIRPFSARGPVVIAVAGVVEVDRLAEPSQRARTRRSDECI